MSELKLTIHQPLARGSIKAETKIHEGVDFSFLLNQEEVIKVSFKKTLVKARSADKEGSYHTVRLDNS